MNASQSSLSACSDADTLISSSAAAYMTVRDILAEIWNWQLGTASICFLSNHGAVILFV